MSHPTLFVLYVDNPTQSTAFYTDLLGHPAMESSPSFAMFALESGSLLGLWARRDVQPAATTTGGAAEVTFAVDNAVEVDRLHAEWQKRGLRIAQSPVKMDFGYTFVALDPDQHRLRVLTPGA